MSPIDWFRFTTQAHLLEELRPERLMTKTDHINHNLTLITTIKVIELTCFFSRSPISIVFLAYKASPRENKEDAKVHGAGQIGLLAALALFGVDYFTSFYYASGEMLHALHPYGLEHLGYITAAAIAFANMVFGGLYMYSLGIFNEGGGSYTATSCSHCSIYMGATGGCTSCWAPGWLRSPGI
jgi:hypothetical protein